MIHSTLNCLNDEVIKCHQNLICLYFRQIDRTELGLTEMFYGC